MRRKVLYIAYHFPPIQGSTGSSRTVGFAKYLHKYSWDVCILTIHPAAYDDSDPENESLIPSNVRVERAWGADTRRSFSLFGRYPMWLALPDRWQSWIAGAYMKGRKIIRDWQPDAIISTYPIPSAHMIGYLLHRRFKLPWIADFRDPMLQPNYPANRWERKTFAKVEELVFSNASEILVTTNGCRQMYLDRYRLMENQSITTISNGYDPSMFESRPPMPDGRAVPSQKKLVLLHSGILYPHERDPTAFFMALKAMHESGILEKANVEFRFRASGNEDQYLELIKKFKIHQYCRFLPRISYVKAIAEMQAVDGLMIFQADNCNAQIPAKVYEYLCSRKPILAMVDPEGDTGQLLRSVGIESIAKLESAPDIESVVTTFLSQLRSGNCFVVTENDSRRFSREALTQDLDKVLRRAIERRDLTQ